MGAGTRHGWLTCIHHVWEGRYELGRQAAMTKLSSNKTVRPVRVRGGNFKFRALRLDTGNYSWGSESMTHKVRILDVVYNSSNNELVRTQTLVKNAIIQVDAAPFRTWYSQHYGVEIGKKKKAAVSKKETEVNVLPFFTISSLFSTLYWLAQSKVSLMTTCWYLIIRIDLVMKFVSVTF